MPQRKTSSSVPRPGRPADPQARAARTRRILDAARRCFARKGFHAASTAEISAEAGISVANLYQYFSTKDSLMMALIEEHLRADLEIIGMLANADSLAEGLKVAEAWIAKADAADTQHPIRVDILAETFRRPEVAAAARRAESEMVGALAMVIKKAKARGEVAADIDPRASAGLIIAFTDGLLSRIAVSPESSRKLASSFSGFVGRALGLATAKTKGTQHVPANKHLKLTK